MLSTRCNRFEFPDFSNCWMWTYYNTAYTSCERRWTYYSTASTSCERRWTYYNTAYTSCERRWTYYSTAYTSCERRWTSAIVKFIIININNNTGLAVATILTVKWLTGNIGYVWLMFRCANVTGHRCYLIYYMFIVLCFLDVMFDMLFSR